MESELGNKDTQKYSFIQLNKNSSFPAVDMY